MSLRALLQSLGIGLGLIGISIWFAALEPSFATPDNFLNILRQSAVNAVIAVGMTFVILTGGIDLSVGSVLALCSVVIARCAQRLPHLPILLAAGIFCGALCGLLNGLVIVGWRVPPFVVTLGALSFAKGLALRLSGGQTIPIPVESFRWLGKGIILGLPVPAAFALLVLGGAALVLRLTAFGRAVYALGGNPEAARLAGLRVNLLRGGVYVLCGALTGLAAALSAARVGAGSPVTGEGYELYAIAAVILGGTSLTGGEGGALGSLLGAIFIATLQNGLNLAAVESYAQYMVVGSVTVLAVVIDRLGRR